MSRKAAEQRGKRAEAWAAFYLRLLGWRILARRLKTPRGEIDLIARRGRTIAFVEVKWRKEQRDLDLAIDGYRLRRVAEAADAVVHRYSKKADQTRIDVLLLAPWRLPRHITHAWQP
ncbi:MAG: YraN family protein [Novosphingobium sp.]